MFNFFLDSLRRDLEERRRKIKKQLEEIAEKSSRNKNDYEARFPQYGRTDDENAEEVATFIDSLSLEKNLEDSLAAVELALSKMDKNQYGVCENCKRAINKKRLKILPTAQYCSQCKDKEHGF